MRQVSRLLPIFFILFNMAAFGQRFPVSGVEATAVSETIYRLDVHEYVTMLAFKGPEGVLLVDSGMEPVGHIADELARIGCGDVRYIVNTHSNSDHVLGNAVLGVNANIISSVACRDDLLKREEFPSEGLPDITFSGTMRLDFNGESVILTELPGHTGNDIVVYFTEHDIVCLGDLIFPDSFPGVQSGRGGNARTLEKSISTILATYPREARFVLGHGREYRWEELKAYHEMVVETIASVHSLIDAGLDAEAIKACNPLQRWRNWDSSFFPGEITAETWIDNIVESVHGGSNAVKR